jgi:hypothetical protein
MVGHARAHAPAADDDHFRCTFHLACHGLSRRLEGTKVTKPALITFTQRIGGTERLGSEARRVAALYGRNGCVHESPTTIRDSCTRPASTTPMAGKAGHRLRTDRRFLFAGFAAFAFTWREFFFVRSSCLRAFVFSRFRVFAFSRFRVFAFS